MALAVQVASPMTIGHAWIAAISSSGDIPVPLISAAALLSAPREVGVRVSLFSGLYSRPASRRNRIS